MIHALIIFLFVMACGWLVVAGVFWWFSP